MKILMRINVVVVEEPSPGVGIYSLHQNFSEVKPIPHTTISWQPLDFRDKGKVFAEGCCDTFYKVFSVFSVSA